MMLHNKLEFTSTDSRVRPKRPLHAFCHALSHSVLLAPQVKTSAALQDVEPELERLRVKASAKVLRWNAPALAPNANAADHTQLQSWRGRKRGSAGRRLLAWSCPAKRS